jgi:hypothetical protein
MYESGNLPLFCRSCVHTGVIEAACTVAMGRGEAAMSRNVSRAKTSEAPYIWHAGWIFN